MKRTVYCIILLFFCLTNNSREIKSNVRPRVSVRTIYSVAQSNSREFYSNERQGREKQKFTVCTVSIIYLVATNMSASADQQNRGCSFGGHRKKTEFIYFIIL